MIVTLLILAMFLGEGPKEESYSFNCHWHGNQTCGAEAPWHGFVNH